MGWRDQLATLIAGRERKQSNQIMQALIQSGQLTARWTPMAYERIVREAYARNPYAFAAVRQISMAMAGIAWKVYDDPSHTNEMEDHPLKTLIERPNPRQGKSQFFENISAYLDLDGNCFIHGVGPKGKPPTELYTLRPDRVTILPGNVANPIAGYLYQVGSAKVTLPAEVVCHLHTFNPLDDLRGMSPIAAAAMSVDQSNASKQWNVALLQNGARPPGALISNVNLDSDQYQRLKEMIQDDYAGFLNAGRPLLLEGGVSWQDMGINPVDMAWLEGQRLSAREIAIVYNIAPELMGDAANKTYSNYAEARVALYEENILPRCDWVRDELNAWLSPQYDDDPHLDYDRSDIEALQEDRDQQANRVTTQFSAGYITVNEARKDTGKDEDDSEYGEMYIWQLPARAPAAPAGMGGLPGPQVVESGSTPLELPAPGEGATPRRGAANTESGGAEEAGPAASPAAPAAASTSEAGAPAAPEGGGGAKRALPFPRGVLSTRLQLPASRR